MIHKSLTLFVPALLLASVCMNAADNLKPSVTWNNICAHTAQLPVIGKLEPVASDLSKPSYCAVGCETLDRNFSDFEKYKAFVGQTGVGYGRLQSGWAKCEPVKGQYNFEWLDRHVDGLLEQGVHPWICLCYGNPAYSDDGYDLNAKLFGEGKVMDAWEKYVEQVVKRYKGKVTMYEVWNEPDGGGHTDSYNTYGVLFAHTSRIIRKYDKDAKIAAIGVCSPDRAASNGGNYVVEAVKKIKDLGALDNLDYITYHAYWPVPERINDYVRNLRAELDAIGCKAGLLQGETGCPGQLEYGHAMSGLEWNEYSQAKWDLRQMFNHFGMGIPYSVFTMVDLNYGWMMQSFGLVRMKLTAEPVYLRPKFHAVQHMTSLLTTEFTPDENVTVQYAGDRKIACVGLRKGGKTVGCALWFCDQIPSGSLERTDVSITINGIDTPEDITYVDMLTGTLHSIPSLRLKGSVGADGSLTIASLPLWDCPIVLLNGGALEKK